MSAKFDRSQLKGTSLSAIKEQNNEIAYSNDRKKRDYLSIDEGTNKFRILPAHPESDPKNRYSQQKYASWLPYFKKDEEGNFTDKKGNRPFLNARIHAGQEKDIIEEFIKSATKIIQSSDDLTTKEKGEKIKALSDFKTGIKHQSKYVCYATKVGDDERGLLELSNGIKKKLDDISLAEYEEEPDGDDIISDPESGVVITIKYDKSKPNTEKYSVQQGRKVTPISDEDLEWWFAEDSLVEILQNSVIYNQATIDRALESLKIYDEDLELDVINSDEFQAIAQEIKSVLPESDNKSDDSSSSDTPSEPSKKKKKKLKDMSKEELKQWILDEDLDIRVVRKDTEEDILDMIEVELGLTGDDYPEVSDEPKKESSDDDEEAFEEEVKEEEEKKPSEERRTRRTRRERG